MAKNLGVVKPDPAPVAAPKAGGDAGIGIGVVRQNEVNRPAEKPPLGVVPPAAVVASVKPAGPPEASVGVLQNTVKVAPPPPPAPKPIGVIEPEVAFPSAFTPAKPRIGAVGDVVVTPAGVAAAAPEKPVSDQPIVIVPNVVSPLEREDEKKK